MNLKDKIKQLPHAPGVYRFIDGDGVILYIGKAKDLKKRVSQYFTINENTRNRKTSIMVSKIAAIEHIIVESEEDALLLENNLIKEHQPKYNILLKDNKTYPWICIKREHFPRVFTTRKVEKDGSLYFGPYSSARHAHEIIELINNLYLLRTCNLALSPIAIEKERFKTCLKYHLKKCNAPCIGLISEEQYDSQLDSVKQILKGRSPELIRTFKQQMKQAAEELRFEDAQKYKERMELLEAHYSRSMVVNQRITDIDVFYVLIDNDDIFGNFMRVRQGAIINSFNIHYKMKIEEEREAILTRFITEAISRSGDLSKEIIVPFKPDFDFEGRYCFTIPSRGDKEALLRLSCKNAAAVKQEILKREEIVNVDDYNERVVSNLMKDLNMDRVPNRIECFDNSNIQGTNPVSSCVVFINGEPCKREYRHFNVKTVLGANDFATMKEVLNRRYSRVVAENGELPQLIVIDGGRGQVNAAYEALVELGLNEITMIGIAKRLEEIIRPGDPYPLFLDKNSTSLKLLMRLRDEAHRFGITHHRNRRSKTQISSQLREIPQIGVKSEEKLLKRYKSVKSIKEAKYEEVAALIGKKAATSLFEYFKIPLL